MNNFNFVKEKIYLFQKFERYLKENKDDIVFLCVGNSDVWYDSFGPIVGSLLKNVFNLKVFIYGDLKNNIKLSNLNKYIKYINQIHFNKKIIIIDAALTNKMDNNIIFKEGKIKCAYFNKDSIPFGHYSILCPIKQIEDDLFNYRQIIENALLSVKIIKSIINM